MKNKRKFIWLSLYILIYSFSVLSSHALATESELKNKTKAVFIYKLLRYISWPESKKPPSNKPYMLCIVEQNELFGHLKYIEEKDKGFVVQAIKDYSDADDCHMVFVSASSNISTQQILRATNSILTIGESSDFFDRGGMIYFSYGASGLKLNINRSRLMESGLKISSNLLRFADIVK
ncbi:MAG: YfiR family protein [Candidatus Nitrohelix vancouverensis]|uniref:YfiR family protein n=1 Tax=Candidatus Nitrohelix vancouverensis TaxID=2705534 RepID=A0A7T0C0A0_9BACT|nr:MAG: YfiR family protein [Candidatus Nitrohelix vancouverensis]